MGTFVSHVARVLLLIVLLGQAGSVQAVDAPGVRTRASLPRAAAASPARPSPRDEAIRHGAPLRAPASSYTSPAAAPQVHATGREPGAPPAAHPEADAAGHQSDAAVATTQAPPIQIAPSPAADALVTANQPSGAPTGAGQMPDGPVAADQPSDQVVRPAGEAPPDPRQPSPAAPAANEQDDAVSGAEQTAAVSAAVQPPRAAPAAAERAAAVPASARGPQAQTPASEQAESVPASARGPQAQTSAAEQAEAVPASARAPEDQATAAEQAEGASATAWSPQAAPSARPADDEPDRRSPLAAPLLEPLYRVPTARMEVVLTIDDGPGPLTGDFLAVLAAEEVPAAFFWLTGSAYLPLAAQVVAQGHQLGTHTISHPRLPTLSPQEATQQIAASQAALEAAAGVPIRYFRPPYGEHDEHVRTTAAAHGMSTVLWSVDSRDWALEDDPEQIVANVMAQVHPGAVILIHERKQTLAVLPRLIRALREAGYTFVPLPAATPAGK